MTLQRESITTEEARGFFQRLLHNFPPNTPVEFANNSGTFPADLLEIQLREASKELAFILHAKRGTLSEKITHVVKTKTAPSGIVEPIHNPV